MGLKRQIEAAWDKTAAFVFDELAEDLEIRLFDQEVTAGDDLYGEALEEKHYQAPVFVKGRVSLGLTRQVMSGGEEVMADGRITFRTDALLEKGIELVMGTLIIINAVDYEVVHIEKRDQVGERYLLTKVMVKER